jgi:hypothetical protein
MNPEQPGQLPFVVPEAIVSWFVVLLLAIVVALFLMGVLLLLMALSDQARRRSASRHRQEIKGFLLASWNTPFPVRAAQLPVLAPREEVCMEIMLDLLRAVDGIDVMPMLRTYMVWGQLPVLCGISREGKLHRRIQAVTLLGHFSDSDTETALVAAMDDPQFGVRLGAMHALAQRGSRELLGKVLGAMAATPLGTDRLFADVLARFGATSAGTLIAQLDRLAHAPRVQAAIVRVLGLWQVEGSLEALAAQRSNPSAQVRLACVLGLGRRLDEHSCTLIGGLLQDPEPSVRTAVAQALGQHRSALSMNLLSAQLHDSAWDVAVAAARSLGGLGAGGRALLRSMADISEPDLAALCRQALAETQTFTSATP